MSPRVPWGPNGHTNILMYQATKLTVGFLKGIDYRRACSTTLTDIFGLGKSRLRFLVPDS